MLVLEVLARMVLIPDKERMSEGLPVQPSCRLDPFKSGWTVYGVFCVDNIEHVLSGRLGTGGSQMLFFADRKRGRVRDGTINGAGTAEFRRAGGRSGGRSFERKST